MHAPRAVRPCSTAAPPCLQQRPAIDRQRKADGSAHSKLDAPRDLGLLHSKGARQGQPSAVGNIGQRRHAKLAKGAMPSWPKAPCQKQHDATPRRAT